MEREDPFSGQFDYQDLFSQLQRMMNGDFWGAVSELQRIRMNGLSGTEARSMWGFPFQSPFSGINLEHFNQLLEQVGQFTGQMQGSTFRTQSKRSPSIRESFPIQIWETRERIILIASIPGLKSELDVKYSLKDAEHLRIRVKLPDFKPQQDSLLILSEIPLQEMTRTVTLPHPVTVNRSTSHYTKGLYTILLYKKGIDAEDEAFFAEEE